MDRRIRRTRPWLLAGLVIALVAPAGAQAATKPAVTTGGASLITFNSARIAGSVNPNGAATTYWFQYGTTKLYGTESPHSSAGGGTKRVPQIADLAGLTPNKTYHYRIVAQNSKGIATGLDRTFKTKKQPLGITLGGNPNPVAFGAPFTLAGQLAGTDNAGRQVQLQANPYPYTGGFKDDGNPQVTDANGNFAFPQVSVPFNTQYRVRMPAKPAVVSPVVLESVAPIVSTHVNHKKVSRGSKVRFYGTVTPNRDGGQIAIQKYKKGKGWVTITGTTLTRRDDSSSKFSKRVRVVHSGAYRVFTGGPTDQYGTSVGRTIRVKVRHR